eukprot:Hpha_TRINITY_DN26673_c0_g1::TRINITY_DN26673_c0_g1_i1::g.86127::m.86127
MLGALLLVGLPAFTARSNSTAEWLDHRARLIDQVYGQGPGVLPTRSVPDEILTWPEDSDPRSKGLQGLVWNMSTLFEITSTVFYSPVSGDPKVRSKTAFLFHHGHSDCKCPVKKGDPVTAAYKCRPGCISSMPSNAEPVNDYTWWDLYNVSTEFHAHGHDVFILSMPLKGINLGPGSNATYKNDDHWWFLQWEEKGDAALRYFLEPAVLTVNYAVAQGYERVFMAGLSGGGWSTTFAAAIDKRIIASFPIAGSVPCSMRNPTGLFPGQNWTGNDREDFEQSCNTPSTTGLRGDGLPGRAAFEACNYTCQYLLAGLEPGRFQVQILHEYDSCCFSPHNRHDGMLSYEAHVRNELLGGDRSAGEQGWFTSVATNHSKHEVAAQDKTVIHNAVQHMLHTPPASPDWERIPCDVMHQALPANCAQNVDPGLGGDPYVPMCPSGPCTCTRPPPEGNFPCKGGQMPYGDRFSSGHAYFRSLEGKSGM